MKSSTEGAGEVVALCWWGSHLPVWLHTVLQGCCLCSTAVCSCAGIPPGWPLANKRLDLGGPLLAGLFRILFRKLTR